MKDEFSIEERIDMTVKAAQLVLSYVIGDITSISIDQRTGKKYLFTLSKKEISEDEFNKLNTEFEDDKSSDANIIKDEGFDAHLRAQ